MSKQASRKNADQKTSVFYAVATFVTFAVVALIVWALTRPAEPVAAATAVPTASAAVTVPAAEHVHDFERISIEDFKTGVDKGEFTVIDVRSMEQYMASHIPGSLHIPLGRIEGEIPYLPKDKKIVTYCTCPAEESSGDAAMILAKGGIKAVALHGGLESWTKLGYPIESGVK